MSKRRHVVSGPWGPTLAKAMATASRGLKTQTGLARRSGVAQSTIGRILRGEVNPQVDNLRRIAEALRIPLATLLDVGQLSHRIPAKSVRYPIFAESDSDVRPDGLMKRHLGYRVEFIAIAGALGVDPEQLLGRVLRWSLPDTEGA